MLLQTFLWLLTGVIKPFGTLFPFAGEEIEATETEQFIADHTNGEQYIKTGILGLESLHE